LMTRSGRKILLFKLSSIWHFLRQGLLMFPRLALNSQFSFFNLLSNGTAGQSSLSVILYYGNYISSLSCVSKTSEYQRLCALSIKNLFLDSSWQVHVLVRPLFLVCRWMPSCWFFT
jgi:hypothetical protein